MIISESEKLELKRRLITILAYHDGFQVNLDKVDTSNNPRVHRWQNIANDIIYTIEQV